MYEHVVLEKYRVDDSGTHLQIVIPNRDISYYITDKKAKYGELRIDDGRHISSAQRKKIYATIRDISEERTGERPFSLSDCSMDTAREFLNTILEYALKEGVPLSDAGVNRTDDIGRYLYYCLKHKKCAVCGLPGEIHHVDTIGMGRDRRQVDDSEYRKICLCRKHHTIAHQRGMQVFEEMYHVYGIKYAG